MKKSTKLVKLGRDPLKQKGFINPGIYKGSTMIFKNFKEYLHDINRKDDDSRLYGIKSNPSQKELEVAISTLYRAKDTVIAPTGMASIIIPFFAFLNSGDEVLINDSVYGPTRIFCNDIIKRLGIKIKYFHPTQNIKNFKKLITKKNKINILRITWNSNF